MSALLARITELERLCNRWRSRYYDMKRGRDMWRRRALRRGL